MSTEPKSKFILFVDQSATAENRRPNLKGEFARADGPAYALAIWGGPTKDGSGIFLKGNAQPKETVAALTQAVAGGNLAPDQQPAGLTLKMGEVVLFENDKGDNDKRPDFYGYARTAEGVTRLAAWSASAANGSLMLRGSAVPFVPKAANEAKADAGDQPTVPEARKRVRQALTKDT